MLYKFKAVTDIEIDADNEEEAKTFFRKITMTMSSAAECGGADAPKPRCISAQVAPQGTKIEFKPGSRMDDWRTLQEGEC
jgi:hypothetical protein